MSKPFTIGPGDKIIQDGDVITCSCGAVFRSTSDAMPAFRAHRETQKLLGAKCADEMLDPWGRSTERLPGN